MPKHPSGSLMNPTEKLTPMMSHCISQMTNQLPKSSFWLLLKGSIVQRRARCVHTLNLSKWTQEKWKAIYNVVGEIRSNGIIGSKVLIKNSSGDIRSWKGINDTPINSDLQFSKN